MNQKVAMITGGASGIGLATARALAKAGHHVVIADVQSEAAEATCQQFRSEQLSASAVALDVSREDAWRSAVEAVTREYGRLDVLVNNAGLGSIEIG